MGVHLAPPSESLSSATLATCELEKILGIVSVTAVLLPEEKIMSVC